LANKINAFMRFAVFLPCAFLPFFAIPGFAGFRPGFAGGSAEASKDLMRSKLPRGFRCRPGVGASSVAEAAMEDKMADKSQGSAGASPCISDIQTLRNVGCCQSQR